MTPETESLPTGTRVSEEAQQLLDAVLEAHDARYSNGAGLYRNRRDALLSYIGKLEAQEVAFHQAVKELPHIARFTGVPIEAARRIMGVVEMVTRPEPFSEDDS